MSTYNHSEHRKWRKYAFWIMVFFSGESAYFSWIGLSADGSYENALVPFLRVVASCILNIVCFSFLFSQLPNASAKARKPLTVFCVLTLLLTLSLSSYYNVCGLGGGRAQQYHNEQLLLSVSAKFDEIIRLRKEELTIVGPIEDGKRAFEIHFANEKKRGGFSGRSGDGMTAGILLSVAQGFEQASNKMKRQEESVARFRPKGRRLLSSIRDTLDDPEITLIEKNALVQRDLNAMCDLLIDLSDSSAFQDVISFTERLDSLILLSATTDGGGKGKRAERQTENRKELIAALKEPIAKSKSMVLEKAESLRSKRHVEIPRYRVLNDRIEAISMHFPHVYSEIATSLSVDFGMGAICLFVLWFLPKFPRKQSRKSRTDGTQVSEAKENEVEDDNEGNKTKIGGTQRHGGTAISDLLKGLDNNRLQA